jgi:hypothetical protein
MLSEQEINEVDAWISSAEKGEKAAGDGEDGGRRW